MLNISLKITKPEPVYAYKRHAYKKKHVPENQKVKCFKIDVIQFIPKQGLHQNYEYVYIMCNIKPCHN